MMVAAVIIFGASGSSPAFLPMAPSKAARPLPRARLPKLVVEFARPLFANPDLASSAFAALSALERFCWEGRFPPAAKDPPKLVVDGVRPSLAKPALGSLLKDGPAAAPPPPEAAAALGALPL